ncbi:MAG: PIN domain-containing protein, partial [Desulfobacterales bacterium]|nr:PIN domain-containing protein [Desulfobacterales bacterium]
YFSQISLIEIAIKLKLGKLKLHVDLPIISQTLQNDGYEQLNIQNKHILSYQHIPLYDNHRDPFDRLLIATALSENFSLITSDEKFILYQNLIPLVKV